MKLATYIFAGLASLAAVQAANTTVSCHACPPSSSVEDIVTRSDEPVPSCTEAKLTAVYNSDAPGATGTPSNGWDTIMPPPSGSDDGAMPEPTPEVPPTAGAGKLVGMTGGAFLMAAVAGFMI